MFYTSGSGSRNRRTNEGDERIECTHYAFEDFHTLNDKRLFGEIDARAYAFELKGVGSAFIVCLGVESSGDLGHPFSLYYRRSQSIRCDGAKTNLRRGDYIHTRLSSKGAAVASPQAIMIERSVDVNFMTEKLSLRQVGGLQ